MKTPRASLKSHRTTSYVPLAPYLCPSLTPHSASPQQLVLRKLRKQAHDAVSHVADTDAAAVNAELDRLGGKTQLIQTIGERVAYCGSHAGRALYATIEKGTLPPSVFEAQSNPNGVLQPTVARDPRPLDAFEDLSPAAAVGAGMGIGVAPSDMGMGGYDFDFMSMGTMSSIASLPTLQPPQQQQQQQQAGASAPDFDWIAGFLSSTGSGVPVPAPTHEQVPNAAEMEANWQSLVNQLNL